MPKIIVVDDDQTNISLLKMLLEMDGFSVEACVDGAQAKRAAAQGVDAFLVDFNLAGGKSGLDLLKDVRAGQTSAAKNTLFIMASGDHRREAESHAAGADMFLLKPYSPTDLSEELSKLLATKEKHG